MFWIALENYYYQLVRRGTGRIGADTEKTNTSLARLSLSLFILLLFSVEKIFERKIFNSVVGVFFPFPDTAHDAQTYARGYCRTDSALKNTYVSASLR